MDVKNKSFIIVGAGNVATHIAHELYRKGSWIKQVFSRSEAAAHQLAVEVQASYTTNMADIKNSADYCIVSLKDDALPVVAPFLQSFKGIVLHTAGSVDIEVLKQCNRYGVLYPMQTFSKKRQVDFSMVPFFVEANSKETLDEVMALAHTFSDNVTETSSEQRRLIHLAAVFACNFTNHMYALADESLKKADMPFSVLLPLIRETAKKVEEMSPLEAQTGPAVRFDKSVMNKHLRLIDGIKNQEIYLKISENIHTFAERKENNL